MTDKTTCSVPPPLTDDDFDRLLDGEEDQALMDHLEQCPDCSRRFNEARTFEDQLRRRLFRWDCPSPDELGDYHMNLLSTGDADRIGKHVATCPHCQAEVKMLADFLADESDSMPVKDKPGDPISPRIPLYAATISARISSSEGAVLRGANKGPVMLETDTGITIFLELQESASRSTLMGQIVSDDMDDWNDALVEVRQTGHPSKYTTVAEYGDFQCEVAPEGSIRLRLVTETGRTIDTPELFVET